MSDPADYLRNAAESDVTADEAWENQQQLNHDIIIPSEDSAANIDETASSSR